jgi:hypothetical protein
MKGLLRMAVVASTVLAAPFACANEGAAHRHRVHHPAHRGAAIEPARPAAIAPPAAVAPAAPSFTPDGHSGEHGNDGLSRDPDDCNKGCIGGNPG